MDRILFAGLPCPFQTSSNVALLKLHTNEAVQMRGFNITYYSIPNIPTNYEFPAGKVLSFSWFQIDRNTFKILKSGQLSEAQRI